MRLTDLGMVVEEVGKIREAISEADPDGLWPMLAHLKSEEIMVYLDKIPGDTVQDKLLGLLAIKPDPWQAPESSMSIAELYLSIQHVRVLLAAPDEVWDLFTPSTYQRVMPMLERALAAHPEEKPASRKLANVFLISMFGYILFGIVSEVRRQLRTS